MCLAEELNAVKKISDKISDRPITNTCKRLYLAIMVQNIVLTILMTISYVTLQRYVRMLSWEFYGMTSDHVTNDDVLSRATPQLLSDIVRVKR